VQKVVWAQPEAMRRVRLLRDDVPSGLPVRLVRMRHRG